MQYFSNPFQTHNTKLIKMRNLSGTIQLNIDGNKSSKKWPTFVTDILDVNGDIFLLGFGQAVLCSSTSIRVFIGGRLVLGRFVLRREKPEAVAVAVAVAEAERGRNRSCEWCE